MASNATSLNVRLGLIFDEKTLAQVERQLRRSGEKLQRVGQDLTLSLSAPLALFGGAAIKAAGDLESLTLALQSQVGTADKAAAELEKLTKVAESPGLGLEQVVKASVSLQAVGIEADRARTIIEGLGKANAQTAGTAEQFGAVTRQFTQMIAKGKIYQEDLMVIQENMPIITTLMKQAFGASSAEDLQKLGINANQFVDGIINAAKALPEVKSGIKNNIENALDATRIALGKVGTAIITSFDVSGKLEAFAKFIGDVAKGFDQLSATTKTAIVSFGAFLIALGPIATTIGNVRIVSSFLIDNWKGLVGASKDVIKWLQLQRAAFLSLNAATQAFVGIGIVVAIATLAYNMGAFNRELSAAEKGMKIVNDLTAQATSDTVVERTQVQALIGVLKSETESRESKIAALDKLKQINPEYFGQLDIEKLSVDKLQGAYEGYAESIIIAARAKRAEGELVRLDEELRVAIEKKEKAQKAYNYMVSVGRAQGSQASELADANAQVDALQRQFDAVKNLVNANEVNKVQKKELTAEERQAMELAKQAEEQRRKAAEAARAAAEAAIEQQRKLRQVYNEVVSDIRKVRDVQLSLGSKDVIEEAQAIESGMKRLIDAGFKPTSNEVQGLRGQLKGLIDNELAQANALFSGNFQPLATLQTPQTIGGSTVEPPDFSGILQASDSFNAELLKQQEALLEARKKGFQDLAWEAAYSLDSLFTAFDQRQLQSLEETYAQRIQAAGEDSNKRAQLEAEFEAKREEIQKRGAKRKKALAMAEAAMNTAVAITKTYAQFGFPFGLGLAAAQAAVGAVQIAAIAATPFAKGTQYAPGGLALVGEQGPELINLPRGSTVTSNNRTNQLLDSMGGGGTLQGEFTVRGTDLVLVLDRATKKSNRAY